MTSDGHVRTPSDAIRAAIQTGADRSQTFRALLIRANDAAGMVYVEPVEHTRHDLDGLLVYSVTTTPQGRYLRVLAIGGFCRGSRTFMSNCVAHPAAIESRTAVDAIGGRRALPCSAAPCCSLDLRRPSRRSSLFVLRSSSSHFNRSAPNRCELAGGSVLSRRISRVIPTAA